LLLVVELEQCMLGMQRMLGIVECRSERARAGPTRHGVIKSFCRQKGHGFIIPRDDQDPIFVHISE